tara:strand:+ start:7283 stop:7699 length:417 start_codon:yes stop_codon:yes gene_type:complete
MGQPGVIKFELPPRPQPRAVGPQVIWAELRAKLQQRIESGSKEDAGKIGTKEAALIGAWAYVCAVGRDDEAFGTTEIKTVLGDSWDAFKRKDSLHTGDLKLNPWIDQIGKSNRYSLNADGIDQAKELMKSLIGDAQEA